MKKIYLFLVLFFCLCLRIKIQDIYPSIYTKIKIGNSADSIQIKYVNKIPVNVPLQTIVENGQIYIPDYYHSQIKLFDIKGKIIAIYGKKTEELLGDFDFYPLKIERLGLFSVSPNGDIFLQIRNKARNMSQSRKYINPSFILHIDRNGEIIGKIGLNGVGSKLPFDYIESISSPTDNRLNVFHNRNQEIVLSFFENGFLKEQISKETFRKYLKEDFQKYDITTERILSSSQGDYHLVCFSYISKKDSEFAFKKIFKYTKENQIKFLRKLESIDEFLFAVLNTNQFYIQKMQKNKFIEIELNSLQNQVLNSLFLNLGETKSLWKTIFINNKDEIFSTHLESDFLEIYRWN